MCDRTRQGPVHKGGRVRGVRGGGGGQLCVECGSRGGVEGGGGVNVRGGGGMVMLIGTRGWG